LLREEASERLSSAWWLRTRPPSMAGCARQLRWSCKLIALQLLRERAAAVSRETVRRALHRLGFRWRRPRPVPPEKDSEEQVEQKRVRLEDVLPMTEQAGSFFQDETKLQTNPKVGFCWMRRGKQKHLRTPGTNPKVWISGALNFKTGIFHWVAGERRNDELFIRLLDKLCAEPSVATSDSIWPQTTTAVISASGSRGMWRTPKGASICILCPRGLLRATRWSWCGGLCTRLCKPQPRMRRAGRSGGARGGLSGGEAAFPVEARGGLQPSGKAAALRSGSVHLSRGAI
jgi:hypothetical protein